MQEKDNKTCAKRPLFDHRVCNLTGIRAKVSRKIKIKGQFLLEAIAIQDYRNRQLNYPQ
jgi:hypothetical protein